MWKMEKIYNVDDSRAKGDLDKDSTKLLSKIAKKSFVSIRAIGIRGKKLEMEKEKLLLMTIK